MGDPVQYTMAGVVAYLIIDKVFKFVQGMRNGTTTSKTVLEPVSIEIKLKEEIYRQGKVGDQIWDVHLGPRALDKNSEPKWYNQSQEQTERHEEVINKLHEVVVVTRQVRDAIKLNGKNSRK